VGRSFAYLETKAVLAELLSRFIFEPVDRSSKMLNPALILKPVGSFKGQSRKSTLINDEEGPAFFSFTCRRDAITHGYKMLSKFSALSLKNLILIYCMSILLAQGKLQPSLSLLTILSHHNSTQLH
jgi:hypothetical protein